MILNALRAVLLALFSMRSGMSAGHTGNVRLTFLDGREKRLWIGIFRLNVNGLDAWVAIGIKIL